MVKTPQRQWGIGWKEKFLSAAGTCPLFRDRLLSQMASDVRPWPWLWGLWPWPWGLGYDRILVIVKLPRILYEALKPLFRRLFCTPHFSSSGTCNGIIMRPHQAHMSNSLLETL